MKLPLLTLFCATAWWFASVMPSLGQSNTSADPFAGQQAKPAEETGKTKNSPPPGVNADPFLANSRETKKSADATAVNDPIVPVIRIEAFSLPLAEARKALVAHSAHEELYGWLDTELEKEATKTKLELFTIVCARPGQRVRTEEITEFPFATSFDPPQIPQDFEFPLAQDENGEPTYPNTPVIPGSYAFNNLGFTLEVELNLEEDNKTFSTNISAALTKLARLVEMTANGDLVYPEFVQQNMTTVISAQIGTPTLMGTYNPGDNAPAADAEKRVWFLFATATRP